ncbi:MAG: sigma-70 family RNA polymerase sigma factor [Bacteroidales bacterium]
MTGDRDEVMLREYLDTGNEEILGMLYSRYMALVYGVCLKYLQEREDARDAVMGIFEKVHTEVWRHEIESFRPWLFVTSRNYCLMELRSRKGRSDNVRRLYPDEELFMEKTAEVHPIDSGNGIADGLLEECIEKLKEEQQRCIKSFYYDNRSYREVAEILKLDEKQVKSHLQNAKRNLKICLDESYEENE